MGFESAKMTEAYLSLWKLLDLRSPDHHWLELTSISEEELKSEISGMARRQLPWAGRKERELKQDIKIVLETLQAEVTPESSRKLDQLRNSFQDKALGYATRKSEIVVTSVPGALVARGEHGIPSGVGVEAAIYELERDVKKVQEAIAMLKRMQGQRSAPDTVAKRGRRRLSAQARRRISEAAKKRWAALRAAKKT